MNDRRVLAGRRAKTTGKLHEDIISASCAAYRKEGTADIEKTPEPMRPIKSMGQGRFIAVYEKKAQVDYKGILKNGKCVAFEAKYTDSDRISRAAVTEAQEEMMDRYSELGGKCFVIVCFGYEAFYKVPWYAWKMMQSIFGHKHIKRDEMPAEWKIGFEQNRLYFLRGETND